LKPISDNVDRAALRVARLDRNRLMRDGSEPSDVMRDARSWVIDHSRACHPVLVGYPVVFDWMFLHWYFVRYVGSSPFGFSSALDMKTMYQQKAGLTVGASGRHDLPTELISGRRHSHNALDDAIEQGEIFNHLFVWTGGQAP
jgi:3'-5' exoribonuclease Rv2179c-like domain